MTTLKLQNIKQSQIVSKGPMINAGLIPLWENKKHHYCIKTLQDMIKTVTSTTYYGSSVKDFIS